MYFSLEEDEIAGRLKVVDVPVKDVLAFKAQFTVMFAGDIDPGEAEALAYLFGRKVDHTICSADKIVFRVLGCLGKGEMGLSLEEILKQCGLTKKLPKKFGKEYREHWTNVGFTEGLQGRALRKDR